MMGRPVPGLWPVTAAGTAQQMMRWAAEPVGPPPRGSLRSSAALVRDLTLRRILQELTRAHAARLGAGQPPLGDTGSVGPGGILLAAALGGRERTEEAMRLAALVPAASLGRTGTAGWLDALARHAVAGRLVTDDDPVSRACLDASPLSAVLVRPADGQQKRAVDAAFGLLGRPRGPEVLTAVLSVPATATEVLTWRARLLSRLARGHPEVVADVYAAALLRYPAGWQRQLSVAADALDASARTGQAEPLAVATVQYWAALNSRQVAAVARTERLDASYKKIRTLAGRFGLDSVRAG